MTAAEKLALLKQLTTTTDTDAVLTAFINTAGQAILNKVYPYGNIDDDRIVESTEMIVGAYDIESQPDYPRNVTVVVEAEDTADTMGTITVTGVDINGTAATDTITPVADATVDGTTVFKRITSVVGAGWVIDAVEGVNDTIKIGVGDTKAVPTKYEYKQVQIAVYLLGRRGDEGQTGHGENGISRSYESADVPPSMLREVVPFVGSQS